MDNCPSIASQNANNFDLRHHTYFWLCRRMQPRYHLTAEVLSFPPPFFADCWLPTHIVGRSLSPHDWANGSEIEMNIHEQKTDLDQIFAYLKSGFQKATIDRNAAVMFGGWWSVLLHFAILVYWINQFEFVVIHHHSNNITRHSIAAAALVQMI